MAESPVLYVYYRPDNDDAYPGVPNRHITEADWARFSPSQRRTVEQATTQDGYTRRKVWLHRDLVDETEQERADREAAEQAARDAYERGQSIVRWRDFEPLVPGPGEVIVGGADGPEARDVSEIGGAGYTIVARVRADATWQQNRDALQSANDEVSAAGGGRVTIPPGTYLAKNVVQDSHVEFFGPGATLKHPDGMTGDIITARRFSTTGTIAAGSTTLTVADASKIELGSMVAIRAAGGRSTRQSAPITTAMSASFGAINMDSTAGWGPVERAWVDDELIEWPALNNTTMLTVTRGAYGTTATTHDVGAIAYQACVLYASVLAVNGTTITLDTPAVMGVTNAPVVIGSVGLGITDLSFDGSRVLPNGSSGNPLPVRWDQVRWSVISGGDYANGDLGGIQLAHGACDNKILHVTIRDSGMYPTMKGAAIWVFRGCSRNQIIAPTIVGACYTGIYIDDRTVNSSEWDASCDSNLVLAPNVNIIRSGEQAGLMAVGSNYNQFIGGSVRGTRVGVTIDSNQVSTHDGSVPTARGNLIMGIDIANCHFPVQVRQPGNRVLFNPWHDCTAMAYDYGGGNVWEGNGLDNVRGAEFGRAPLADGYHWIGDDTSGDTSNAFTNGTLLVIPFDLPRTMTVDEIGIEVVTPANEGATLRVGYYYDTGKGMPGAVAWDSSTTRIDLATAGVKYITTNRTLAPNRYWFAMAFQGVSTTPPTVRIISGASDLPMQARPDVGGSSGYGYRHLGTVTGSLPASFVVDEAVSVAPLMYVHATTPSL